MIEKYIEWDNPWDKSGKTRLKVVRETKTQYIACSGKLFERYKKPAVEYDGTPVERVHVERWPAPKILRIIDNKGVIK